MPRLAGASSDRAERGRMLGRLLRERQRFVAAGCPSRRGPMHVQVAPDLSPLLGQQHREEKAWAEELAERCQETRARSRPERARRTPVLGEELRPHLNVSILDLRK